MEVFTWNTGAPYTEHGQRIRAEVTDNGEIHFKDQDRGISGQLQSALPDDWREWNAIKRIHWIHQEYLHNRYSMSLEPMMWQFEDLGQYTLIRM